MTAAKRGKGNSTRTRDAPQAPAERRASMTWAQRLKRAFNIDIDTCRACGGGVKVIACIEDPLVIKKILTHLRGQGRHHRATCSADTGTSMTRNSTGCNPDGWAGKRLASWLEFGGNSLNPGLASAVFIGRRVELGRNSCSGAGELL